MFMQNKLWNNSQQKEWELTVVDPTNMQGAIVQLTDVQLQVLKCLLSGLLLKEQQEAMLIEHLSEKLSIPKRQCVAALGTLAQAGIIISIQHPWKGVYWLMPLPIFQSWRAELLQGVE